MPALAFVPGVCLVTWKGTLAGVNVANTFHVRDSTSLSAWTQADATDLATFMRAQFVTQYIPNITNSYTLTDCVVVDLTSATGVSATASGSTAGGITTATGLPSNIAACIGWKTALRFRGGHARLYVPPPSTNQQLTLNTWTASYVTALLNGSNAMLTAINGHALPSGDAIQPVLVSRIRNGVQLSSPLVNVITAATVDNRIDSQRRRLGKDR